MNKDAVYMSPDEAHRALNDPARSVAVQIRADEMEWLWRRHRCQCGHFGMLHNGSCMVQNCMCNGLNVKERKEQR
jgi:hypothetical protein